MSDTLTAADLAAMFDQSTLTEEEVAQAKATATPAKNGMQRQGDLLVIPADILRGKPTTGPVTPLTGQVVALKGSGNEHVLTADGNVTWAAVPAGDANLGVLTVAPGSVATLAHTGHHGDLRIAPGEYVLRRQAAHTAPARDVPPFVGAATAPRPRPRRWAVD